MLRVSTRDTIVLMLSCVVPICNEEESIELLFDRLNNVLHALTSSYEIIFIDDGSTDNSLNILQKLSKKHTYIKIFSFRKNHGKAEALTVGFQVARGDIIITLDGDLQDRPEEISLLITKMKEGFDVVSGWRKNRKDASKMVFASKLFNSFAGKLWGVQLHDYNCGLKAYIKEAAQSLRLYGGMHRFIPLLCHENGFSVAEVAVQHDPRKFGKSKYNFSKTWRDLPDMFTIFFLTRYTKRPLHFFGTAATILGGLGLIFILYLTYLHYVMHETVGTRPLWSIGVLLILAGLQIFFTGFLADLLINLSQNRKTIDVWKNEFRYTTDKL